MSDRWMRFVFVSLFVFAAAFAAVPPGAAAPVPTGLPGINVELTQLTWLDTQGKAAVPLSRVLTAELSFDAKAAPRLAGVKRGAFFNLYVSRGAEAPAWVVRNLYLRFPSEPWMLGSKPSVQFSLDLPQGVKVQGLSFTADLSAKPRREASLDKAAFRPVEVGVANYLVGGRNEQPQGKAISRLADNVPAWVGFVPAEKDGLGPDDLEESEEAEEFEELESGNTLVAMNEILAIDEDVNGCAPAAVARSIEYLLNQSPSTTTMPHPQDLYEDLYDLMDTDEEDGTYDDDLVAGKNAYNAANGLPIDTAMDNSGMGNIDVSDLIDQLNGGADVEILISWNGGSGHVAMVTSVTILPDGSVQITYVDDPTQGDGIASNQEHTIIVDPSDGSFGGGTVDGFVVETLQPVLPGPGPGPGPVPGPGTFHPLPFP